MILSPKMIFVLLFILFIAGCGLNNESLGPTEEQKEEALSTQVLAIAHVARSLGAGQFTKSILSSITELFDVVAGFDQDSQRKSKKGKTLGLRRF